MPLNKETILSLSKLFWKLSKNTFFHLNCSLDDDVRLLLIKNNQKRIFSIYLITFLHLEYIYIYVCVFGQHFFINAYFIKKYRCRFVNTFLYMSFQQNNKRKLQFLKALHIRMKQPKLNRINFKSSTNVLKCL